MAHTDDMVRFLVSSKCILVEDHTLIFFNIKKVVKNVQRIDFFSNFAEIFEYIFMYFIDFQEVKLKQKKKI